MLSTGAIVHAGDNPAAESLIGAVAGDGAGVVIAIVGKRIDANHIDFGGQGDPLNVGNRLPYAEDSGPGDPTEATGAASLILQLLPNARIIFIDQDFNTQLNFALQRVWDIKNGTGKHPITMNPIPQFNIVSVLVVDQHLPSASTMNAGPASQAFVDLFDKEIIPVAPAGDAMGFSIGNAGVGYPAYDVNTIAVAACFDKIYFGDYHFCGGATGSCDPLAVDNQTNYDDYANPSRFLAMSQRQRQSTYFNPQMLRYPLDIVSPGAEIRIPVHSASTSAGARPLETGYGTVYGAAYVTAAIAQSVEIAKKSIDPGAHFAELDDVRDALQSSLAEVLNHEDEEDIEDNVADLGGTFNGPGDELGRVKRLGIPSLIATTTQIITIPPTTPGDFDDDGVVDEFDVCVLQLAIELQSADLTYDLNHDLSVDFADLEFLIHNVLLTVFGDANLDRKVDPADMNIVGLHWGQTGVCWEQGDFNGDDTVDAADLNYVGQNWLFGTL